MFHITMPSLADVSAFSFALGKLLGFLVHTRCVTEVRMLFKVIVLSCEEYQHLACAFLSLAPASSSMKI